MKLKDFVVNSLPRRSKRKKNKSESTPFTTIKDTNDNDITENVYATLRDVKSFTKINHDALDFLRDIDIGKYRLDSRVDFTQLTVSCDEFTHNLYPLHNDDSPLYDTLPRRPNIRTNPWCAPAAKRMTASMTSGRSTPSPNSINSLSSSFVSSYSTEASESNMSTGSDVSWCADDGYETLRSGTMKNFVPENYESRDSFVVNETIQTSRDGNDNQIIREDLNRAFRDDNISDYEYEVLLNDLLESDDLKTSDSQISLEELIKDDKNSKICILPTVLDDEHYQEVDNQKDEEESSRETSLLEIDDDKSLSDDVFYDADATDHLDDVETPDQEHIMSKTADDNRVEHCDESQNQIATYRSDVKLSRCLSAVADIDIRLELDIDLPEIHRPRSLSEVTASLVDKVTRLREEKVIVQQRIMEAQEEQRLRMREKQKLHRQMSLHRKQLLLKTLQELKERLQTQTNRLQTSYDAIILLQRRFSAKNDVVTYIL